MSEPAPIRDLHQQPKVLILRMRHVPFIDATGISILKETGRQLQAAETSILVSGANREVN